MANFKVSAGEYGINETEQMMSAAIALKQAVKISKADDGKVTFPDDLFNFINVINPLIIGITGADQIGKELADLDQDEIERLRAKFGQIVDDERYQRIFYGLAIAGDAAIELIRSEEKPVE